MTLLCSNLRYCVCVCLEGLRESTKDFDEDIPSPGRNLNREPFENEPELLAILQRHSLKGYSGLCKQTAMCFLIASTAYVSLQQSWLRGHQCSWMTDVVLFSRSVSMH